MILRAFLAMAIVVAALPFVTSVPAFAAAETCTVNTGSSIAFGSFDVFVAPTTVTATINGTCKKGSGSSPATISITLDQGLNGQASGNRAMSCTTCTGIFASDLLQYQIYTSASTTAANIWNATNGITVPNPCPCSGNTSVAWGPLTMYALLFTAVPGGINDSAVGSYSDTVTATVNY